MPLTNNGLWIVMDKPYFELDVAIIINCTYMLYVAMFVDIN